MAEGLMEVGVVVLVHPLVEALITDHWVVITVPHQRWPLGDEPHVELLRLHPVAAIAALPPAEGTPPQDGGLVAGHETDGY